MTRIKKSMLKGADTIKKRDYDHAPWVYKKGCLNALGLIKKKSKKEQENEQFI